MNRKQIAGRTGRQLTANPEHESIYKTFQVLNEYLFSSNIHSDQIYNLVIFTLIHSLKGYQILCLMSDFKNISVDRVPMIGKQ